METAIIGTDLSLASDRILDMSPEFRTFGIKRIVLVYVVNLRSTTDFAEYNLDSAQDRLTAQRQRLENHGYEADTSIVLGVPALELMRQAKIQDAGLIIIGSRGSSWNKPTLGETASEVLHNLKYPVLLVAFSKKEAEKQEEELKKEDLHHFEKFIRQFRKQEPKAELLQPGIRQHVLLTTDFSDFSENAFQWLKNQSVGLDKLTLLHIQDEVRIAKHLEHKLEDFNRIDRARLERLREEYLLNHPATQIDLVLEYGNPKQLISHYIQDKSISMTVMGSQGRGYISEFFLGSVSLRIARQADSNLLVIPFNKKL